MKQHFCHLLYVYKLRLLCLPWDRLLFELSIYKLVRYTTDPSRSVYGLVRYIDGPIEECV